MYDEIYVGFRDEFNNFIPVAVADADQYDHLIGLGAAIGGVSGLASSAINARSNRKSAQANLEAEKQRTEQAKLAVEAAKAAASAPKSAAANEGNPTAAKGLPVWAWVAIGLGGTALLGLILWLVLRKK